MKNADEYYKPIILKGVLVDTIAIEPIQKGSTGKYLIKGFISSIEAYFSLITKNLLTLFHPHIQLDSVSRVLIIIKKDNSAKIYLKYPLMMLACAKRDFKKGEIATEEEIFDITQLDFKDSIYEVDIEKNDKIIFLFRINWTFGLFFDFTKNLDLIKLRKELGHCYKRLYYDDLYAFIENEKYFNNLISDGWFPFIRLIGKQFKTIIQHYKDGKKHPFIVDELVGSFTKEKIELFTQYWWNKTEFHDKKEIIQAGIDSFLQNNTSGFISCIHILYPQIEGIMGNEYFKTTGKKLSQKNLLDYIQQKGTSKYHSLSSVGFPREFYEYLLKAVFDYFDITTGKLDLSRHTVSHGYANVEEFNKAKALQAILILDQIYFYI